MRSIVGWNRISRDPIEPGPSKMLGLIRKLQAIHTHISYALCNVWWRDKRCWRITHTHTKDKHFCEYTKRKSTMKFRIESALSFISSSSFFPFRTKKMIYSFFWAAHTHTISEEKYCNRINSRNQSSENSDANEVAEMHTNRHTIIVSEVAMFVLSFIRVAFCASEGTVNVCKTILFHTIRVYGIPPFATVIWWFCVSKISYFVCEIEHFICAWMAVSECGYTNECKPNT